MVIVPASEISPEDAAQFLNHFLFVCTPQISKSNVVDDMVESNNILYEKGEKPDHCVVIKYVPYVGDSKRAMDEYTSEIFMHGLNTIVLHNTCEVTKQSWVRTAVKDTQGWLMWLICVFCFNCDMIYSHQSLFNKGYCFIFCVFLYFISCEKNLSLSREIVKINE